MAVALTAVEVGSIAVNAAAQGIGLAVNHQPLSDFNWGQAGNAGVEGINRSAELAGIGFGALEGVATPANSDIFDEIGPGRFLQFLTGTLPFTSGGTGFANAQNPEAMNAEADFAGGLAWQFTSFQGAQQGALSNNSGSSNQDDNWITVYRGQAYPTDPILGYTARMQGLPYAENLLQEVRSMGITDEQLALLTAKGNSDPVTYGRLPQLPNGEYPYKLIGEFLGGLGIPTSASESVAEDFALRTAATLAQRGETVDPVVYTLRVPRAAIVSVPEWLPDLQGVPEFEKVIFNSIPNEWIIGTKHIPFSNQSVP